MADIECADDQRNTAVAMRLGNHKLFSLLVSQGARLPVNAVAITLPNTLPVDERDAFRLYVDRQVLQQQCRLAAARGDLATVTMCHQRGANLNARNHWGGTALSTALQYSSYLRVVHYLVSRNASVLHGHTESRMSSVIQHCINKRYPDRLRLYLELTINQQMQRAVVEGNKEMRNALAGIGKQWWEYKDTNGNSALHLAIQNGREPEWLQWLCNSGCSLQEANAAGDYPIHEATMRADNGSIDFITQRDGTAKELVNAQGRTAFELAKELQYFHLASQLDSSFVKPTEAEEKKYTGPPKYTEQQLIRAAAAPNMSVIREFIEQQYLNIPGKAVICGKMLEAASRRQQREAMAILKKHLDYLQRHVVITADPFGHIAFRAMIHNFRKAMLPPELQSLMDEPEGYNKIWSRMLELRQRDELPLTAPVNEADALKAMEREANRDRERANQLAEQLRSVRESQTKYMKEQQEAREQLIVLQTKQVMMERVVAAEQKEGETRAELNAARANAMEKFQCAAQIQALEDRVADLQCAVKVIEPEYQHKLQEAERKEWVKAQGPSALHFHNTLQLFLVGYVGAVASNQCGVLTSNTSTTTLTQQGIITVASTLAGQLPFVGSFIGTVVSKAGDAYVSGLNKKRQMQEAAAMTALGSRVELTIAMEDASYLITRFYAAQLRSLPQDQGKPLGDRACYLLAAYTNIVIVSSLNSVQPLPLPALPLSQRIWLVIASLVADDQKLMRQMKDRVDDSRVLGIVAQQLSPGSNKILISSGHTVRLRDLFLTVMLKTKDGTVYAPRAGEELAASTHCGMVSTVNIVARTDIDAYIIEQRELTQCAAPHDHTLDETTIDTSSRTEGELASPRWAPSATSSGFSTPRRAESQQRWSPTTEDIALEVQALLEKNRSLMTTERAEELIHDEQYQRSEKTEAALVSMKCEMDASRYMLQATIDQADAAIKDAVHTLHAKQSKDIATHQQQLQQYTAAEDSKFDGRLTQMTKLYETSLRTTMEAVASHMRQLTDKHQQQMQQLQQAHITASDKMVQEHQVTVRALEQQTTNARQSAAAAQADTAKLVASFEEQRKEFDSKVVQWSGSFNRLLADGNASIAAATASLQESKMMNLASMAQATDSHQRAMAEQKKMAESARDVSLQAATQSSAAQVETRKAREQMEKQRKEATQELERQRKEAGEELEKLRRASADELERLNTAMMKEAEKQRKVSKQANEQAISSAKEAERATRELLSRSQAK